MDEKNKKLNLLDVGIPIFNEENHLLKTLKNLSSIKNKKVRFLISDNSSNDKSSIICKKISKKDKRFKYYYQKKKISSFQNFNYIFKKSNSKYFIWNSGHDLRSKNFLQDCIKKMEMNNDIALCYSTTKIIGKKELKIINIENQLKANNFFNIFSFFYNLNYNYQVYGMFRSKILNKTQLFPNFIGGDICLIKEIAFLGKICKLKTKSFTSLRIDDFGDWNEYVNKHLNSSKKINFFKDYFLSQLINQMKIIKNYNINIFYFIFYFFLIFFKLIKNLIYIYYARIKKSDKKIY